jgi:hypothetical protein
MDSQSQSGHRHQAADLSETPVRLYLYRSSRKHYRKKINVNPHQNASRKQGAP